MKIIVFGANGPTGRRLIAAALAEGNVVTAYTRKPKDFPISHRRLGVAAGDVLDAEVVAAAVRGQDAVLSTLGRRSPDTRCRCTPRAARQSWPP